VMSPLGAGFKSQRARVLDKPQTVSPALHHLSGEDNKLCLAKTSLQVFVAKEFVRVSKILAGICF
jgi:hypothetical protein